MLIREAVNLVKTKQWVNTFGPRASKYVLRKRPYSFVKFDRFRYDKYFCMMKKYFEVYENGILLIKKHYCLMFANLLSKKLYNNSLSKRSSNEMA